MLPLPARRNPGEQICFSAKPITMTRTIFRITILGLLVWGGGHWYSSYEHDQFIAKMKSEFSAYRIEYFEQERLLFRHPPAGKREGIELTNLNRVILWRLDASDASDNQTHYYWIIENPGRDFTVPYFAIEPAAMLNILKKEIPELDIQKSLKHAAEFENGKFTFCTTWASQKHIEATRKVARTDKNTCAP